MDFDELLENPEVRKAARKAVQKLLRNRLVDGMPYSPESLPDAAKWARRRAAALHVWEAMERADLVKLELEPDDCVDIEDLEGDSYNVELNKDSVPGGERTILAQQKRFREKVEQDGVATIVGYYRLHEDDEWNRGGCIGGMAGYDEPLDQTDCADEVREETLDLLVKAMERESPVEGILESLGVH